MVDAVDNPFVFGCLALDIAGFKVNEIDSDILANNPNEGYRLVFGINEKLTLALSFDKESQDYIVAASIPNAIENKALLEMALKLNFVLLEQRRSFSVSPESNALVLTQLVSTQRLELDILAEAVADLTQTILALDGYDFGKDARAKDTQPVDWNNVVRG